jgi:hypothetical protein
MRTRLLLLLALPACAFPVTGDGVPDARTISVGGFREVEVIGSLDVRVTPGDPGELTLRCDRNLIDHLDPEVDDGVLEVDWAPGVEGWPQAPCWVEVHRDDLRGVEVTGSGSLRSAGALPKLRWVEVSGSGRVDVGAGADSEDDAGEGLVEGEDAGGSLVDAEADAGGGLVDDPAEAEDPDGEDADDPLTDGGPAEAAAAAPVERLEIEVSGSGDVALRGLAAQRLEVEVTGSGRVQLQGEVGGTAEIEVTGSGDAELRRARARRVVAEVTGSGRVVAHAREAAVVEVTGSGDVVIYGDPQRREVEETGSGQVRFR